MSPGLEGAADSRRGPPARPRPPREQDAVARFDPHPTWLRRLGAAGVGVVSRFLMTRANTLEVTGAHNLAAAREREAGRGLLTFSNHVSLFDDPLLLACLGQASWEDLRWVAADALNFFGSPLRSAIFNAGKCVPIVRGAGLEQPGMTFLAERLRAGAWVHVFPEGGRTRRADSRLQLPLKDGLATLVQASRPLVQALSHRGMHTVLPIGSLLPRMGQRVCLLVDEARDSDHGLADEDVPEISRWAGQRLEALEQELYREGRPAGPRSLDGADSHRDRTPGVDTLAILPRVVATGTEKA